MAENLKKRGRSEIPNRPPKAPAGLGRDGRQLWNSLTGEWVLGADALPLLRAACEQLDLYRSAFRQVARDGPTVMHPETKALRQHPAHGVARDALREFRQLMRQLALDPPAEIDIPGGEE